MGNLPKVQEIGLSTQEEKPSQITLTSKLIAQTIQQLELYPHGIRMVATKNITVFPKLQVHPGASLTDLINPSLFRYDS